MTAIDSSFDLFSLTDEHHELRAAIRALTERDIVPHAADCDEKERFPSEALDALNQSGFNAVHIPEAYGGQGADAVATCIVIEEVARGCCSSSLIPAVNKLGTMGLILSGAEDLKQQVLPDIVTDPDKGANGISAFMVHKDDEGFSVGPKERKMGIKGSPTTELYFENCHIPGDRIIGEPGTGLKTALKTLDHTRPTVGAQAVGVAQGALDAAVGYTKDRKQFGKSISSFQAVQFELADMAMKVEAARLMVYTAAARAQRGEPGLSFISAAAKCFASDVAMDVTESAVQLLGGAGYTRDFPVERMMRDAKITQIYEGTNQIQHIVMSRALLAA